MTIRIDAQSLVGQNVYFQADGLLGTLDHAAVMEACKNNGEIFPEQLNSSFDRINLEETITNAGFTFSKQGDLWALHSDEEYEEGMTFPTLEDVANYVVDVHGATVAYDTCYETYAVSDWLAEKLLEQGEVVVSFLGMNVWGRCEFNQPVYSDSVIKSVVKALEVKVKLEVNY
jgi:hypothetical protein